MLEEVCVSYEYVVEYMYSGRAFRSSKQKNSWVAAVSSSEDKGMASGKIDPPVIPVSPVSPTAPGTPNKNIGRLPKVSAYLLENALVVVYRSVISSQGFQSQGSAMLMR